MNPSSLDELKKEELDIVRVHFGTEVKRRLPWIFFSVAAGIIMVSIGRYYEATLSKKVELVFFIPMIVYISDSIGSGTLSLFVRELDEKKFKLRHIFLKEILVGLCFGVVSGLLMASFCFFMFKDTQLALAIGTAMLVNGLIAVMLGMILPITFAKLKKDPALGTDAITTALSDNISILVYLLVATLIIFR